MEKPPKNRKIAKTRKLDDRETFACEFCKHKFVTERGLLIHLCEPKRRHIQRDDKHIKMAFIAYQRVFQQNMAKKVPPTYESFAKSNLYLAFVRFARYLMNINAVNPLRFIDFLLRAEVGIDRWEQPFLYETYVRELNKSELPMEALERNMLLMQQWSVDTGDHWTDFFRKVAPAQATMWIKSGRLSPWIILTAISVDKLFERLSPEQKTIVNTAIDKNFWQAKIGRHLEVAQNIRDELTSAGM